MDSNQASSLAALFFAQVRLRGDAPFLWRRGADGWHSISWNQAAERVSALARGLIARGLQPGGRVFLVCENRPDWALIDLATITAGGVTVPGYTTNTVADHLHVINNAGPSIAVVSTAALAQRVIAAAARADSPPLVVTIDDPGLQQNPGLSLVRLETLEGEGRAQPDDIAARVDRLRRTDLACVIYTSGTGGVPKGVMQTHGAILHNCYGATKLLEELGLENEVFLSFLPLSHAYEHTGGQFFPISVGAQIYYCESTDQLVSQMAEVHPTIMTAVPRLYEVMRARILRTVEREEGIAAKLFRRAVDLGSRRYEDPKSLTIKERIENLLLTLLVRRKVAKRFGGRLKALVSGGAPLNYEVGLFFTALGICLLQGYGQTEAGPVISCNRPSQPRLRTVGPPLAGTELRIAGDGEILVRSESVMPGYWNDPAATALAIRDGWLHTGDVGHVDQDGCIVITDRKRDIIVNSGGDNISPQRVEGFLTLQPQIAQAMAYGDKKPYLVALLVPTTEFVDSWAKANGRPPDLAALATDDAFRKALGEAVERVNRDLSQIERVRRFVVVPEVLTVENGMSTPTMKLRRHAILAKYREALEGLYRG